MLAPQYAVTAPPTDRVEIVVLRVALAAEPCIRVPASRASVAVSIPCALGSPDLRFNQCRHFVYPCPCVEAARKILSAGTASASVNPRARSMSPAAGMVSRRGCGAGAAETLH